MECTQGNGNSTRKGHRERKLIDIPCSEQLSTACWSLTCFSAYSHTVYLNFKGPRARNLPHFSVLVKIRFNGLIGSHQVDISTLYRQKNGPDFCVSRLIHEDTICVPHPWIRCTALTSFLDPQKICAKTSHRLFSSKIPHFRYLHF